MLTAADAYAKAAGLSEHLRTVLENYTTHTVPALNIDGYAQKVYQANRAAGR